MKQSKILSEFAQRFDSCFNCGCPFGLQIHHIARGSHRQAAREEECSLLRLCARCHGQMDGLEPLTQLAIQAVNNPLAYDRVRLNRLRGRADDAISEQEVIAEVCRIVARKQDYGRYT